MFTCLFVLPLVVFQNDSSPPFLFTIDRQSVSQRQGRWLIQYQLCYHGHKPLNLRPEGIAIAYQAELSNSRVPEHYHPLPARAEFFAHQRGVAEVIADRDLLKRCQEIVTASVRLAPLAAPQRESFVVHAGTTFWLTIEIVHNHFLYERYDPLGGKRTFVFTIGNTRLRDNFTIIPDDRDRLEPITLSQPPADRLDFTRWRVPPASIYLCADIGGWQHFRFNDIAVPPDSQWRISFWYFIADGTQSECHVRLMEYQDYSGGWSRLEGGFDLLFSQRGSWQKMEKTVRLGAATNVAALDFRLVHGDVGELWINDVSMQPSAEKKPRSP